ncbi:protein kinase domain-containing protein [Pseudonocardia sp. CA-107938]|uniref:protein kinase domain-containing protein n=1 Tax=Pseudonocardia sp. CA-107938 TaxID=3240021 RepID=UPI003D8EFC07
MLVAADGPRLIDFGIARVADVPGDPLTVTPSGMIVGTPGYLAPEQLRGAGATPASDVFALGALLAFAATGRVPFPGATPAEVMLRTMTGEPDLSGLPQGLLPVVQRCLDRAPERRPSVAELVRLAAVEVVGPDTDTDTDPLVAARPTDPVPPRRTRVATPEAPARPAAVADVDPDGADLHRFDHLPVHPARLLIAAVLVGAVPGLLVLWATASTLWAVVIGAGVALAALFLLVANNARAETPAQRRDVGNIETGLGFVASVACALAVSLHTFTLDWWWHVAITVLGWGVVGVAAAPVFLLTERFGGDLGFMQSAAGIGMLSAAVATLLLLFGVGASVWFAVVGGIAAGAVIGVAVFGLARPKPLTV